MIGLLLILQIALGMATVYFEVPIWLALLHQANGILLFAVVTLLLARILQAQAPEMIEQNTAASVPRPHPEEVFMTTAYQTLEARAKRVADIGGALAILGWDAQTMMPKGGSEARGDQVATLAEMAHEIETALDLPDLLDEAEAGAGALDAWQAANLKRMRLTQRRAASIDPALVSAMAKATNRAEMTWRDARAKADFKALLPDLEEVFRLTREKASSLAKAFDLSPYDALLDSFEHGLRRADIDPLFDRLAGFLPDFLERVLGSQKKPLPIDGPFPAEAQKALGKQLMAALGFDFNHGRLDESQHPFCGGLPDDVRITTRYDEAEITSALMGVLHETGHALYEAGLPKTWRGQPVGTSLGMAVHESQSLLIEMQVCRSRGFLDFLSPHLKKTFGARDAFAADNLYRDAIWVERGLIRVDADEVTYPLHIILRYRMEQALLSRRSGPCRSARRLARRDGGSGGHRAGG